MEYCAHTSCTARYLVSHPKQWHEKILANSHHLIHHHQSLKKREEESILAIKSLHIPHTAWSTLTDWLLSDSDYLESVNKLQKIPISHLVWIQPVAYKRNYSSFHKPSYLLVCIFWIVHLPQEAGSSEPSAQSTPWSQYQWAGIQRPDVQRNSLFVQVIETGRKTTTTKNYARLLSSSYLFNSF